RGERGGRGGGRRLELHPAIAGRVYFGPGVGVDLTQGLHARRVGRALEEADAEPRRQPQRASHHDPGRGVVVAKARLQVAQEVIDDVDVGWDWRQVERVGVLTQELLDGARLVVVRRQVAGDL